VVVWAAKRPNQAEKKLLEYLFSRYDSIDWHRFLLQLLKTPMRFLLILSLLFAPFVRANVPSLTVENYASMTDGKAVFIKFFAPW
jgi:hypothetical protein